MPYGLPMGGAGAAAAGGLLGGPMGALLLPLLQSFGPALLSKLFGGKSPQEKLRGQVQGLLAPQNMSKLTNQFYQQALGSPAYSQGQQQIAAGASEAGNQLQANLGAHGIGTSGSAAVLSSLVPSLVGSQQAGLKTGAYGMAQGQAQQSIEEQIKNLLGTSGPSQNTQLFGAGLSSFAPFLQQFMASRYPGIYGTQSPGGGFPRQ